MCQSSNRELMRQMPTIIAATHVKNMLDSLFTGYLAHYDTTNVVVIDLDTANGPQEAVREAGTERLILAITTRSSHEVRREIFANGHDVLIISYDSRVDLVDQLKEALSENGLRM